jgi:acyl-CoA reductase-like NAD-dependent aldehyde dehydrogenase
VQAHGPGFSKILLGDDIVDDWEKYLDVMVESVIINGGRSCINCSGIWASRHTKEIAQAIAERVGPTEPKSATDPNAALAAFTNPDMAEAVWGMVETDIEESGVTDMTAAYGDKFHKHERYAFICPVVLHCESAECEAAKKEYMFPFVTVVECPQDQMIKKIGYTLVGTAITEDAKFVQQLGDAVNIDRLNIGPIPTNRLNWLQPHEGNLIEFLFRSRAYQVTEQKFATV